MNGVLPADRHSMLHPTQQKYHAAARRPLPTLTLSRNGKTRSVALRPWLVGLTLSTLVVLSTGYVGGTLYLVFRDDLIGGVLARQKETSADYEDRIAALRSEVDRITSRHVVATEGVEQQLGILLDRQAAIEHRQSDLDRLAERARANGVATPADPVSLPRARPADEAAVSPSAASAPLGYAPSETADDVITGSVETRPETGAIARDPARLKPLISGVQSSLDVEQDRQQAVLEALTRSTGEKTSRLSAALATLGATTPAAEPPEGGPFIPATGLQFAERAALLGRSLDGLAALRRGAEALPLAAPLRAKYVSSGFGYRVDPFLGRPSLHPGLDLVADIGTEVHATAAGVVVSAGWSGGYGQMVEIRHAGGVSTRYGHLSRILVAAGTTVAAGTPIGLVGSTGRSTGPHLHYETRRNGSPEDPTPFLAAGRAL